MRTLIVWLFCGSFATCTFWTTATLEPLMIVKMSETLMSPIEIWESDFRTETPQNTTFEHLLNYASIYGHFVSSRIDEWDNVRPARIKVRAVNYNGSELQTLEEIIIGTRKVGNSSFNSWMKNDYLLNNGRVMEQIECPAEALRGGSQFRYKYTQYTITGKQKNFSMVLLWDEEQLDHKGLLLTSKQRNIGNASDIRFNLGIHTYTSRLHRPESQNTSGETSERISLQNQKITRTNHTTINRVLWYLRFDMEEGVIVKSFEVHVNQSDSSYKARLKLIKGELLTELVQGSRFIFKDQEDTKCSHLEIIGIRDMPIYSMEIVILYSYLPYDVADYLVVEGIYLRCEDPPYKAYTVVNGTGTAHGSRREYRCEDGASLEYGLEPAVVFCYYGTWSHPQIKCAKKQDEPSATFQSSTINTTTSNISITKRNISYPTSTLFAETTMTNFLESTTTFVEETSTTFPTTSITERTNTPPSSNALSETTEKESLTTEVPTSITSRTDDATESNTLTDVMTSVEVSTHPPTTSVAATQPDDMSTQATRCTRLCSCGPVLWGNSTMANLEPAALTELLRTIAELKSRLEVKKNALSSYKATKISAPDDRQSASGIGAAGIVIIVFVVLVIIMADVMSFCSKPN